MVLAKRKGGSTSRLRLELLETRDTPTIIGGLDPSFGIGGMLSYNLGGGDVTHDATKDSAGRIVVAAQTPGAGGADFLIERLNPDGTLDGTFGSGGMQTIDFGGGNDIPNSVAIDPFGNIVVGGFSTLTHDRVAVARLLPNGQFDSGFGAGGIVILPFTGSDLVANAVLPDGAGGVVVAGTLTIAGTSSFSIGKLTNAGAIDKSFGTNGNITFNFASGTSDELKNAIQDANGNIVLVGSSTGGVAHRFAVARLTSAGALDGSFGTGGKTAFNIDPANDDIPSRVREDANGKLVIVGTSIDSGTDHYFAVTRLLTNGALDTGFGAAGKVLGGFAQGAPSVASDVLIQPSGRIVVGGTAGLTGGYFTLLRLTPEGSLDFSFNLGGSLPGRTFFQFAPLNLDQCAVLLPGADERILAIGSKLNGSNGVEVARLIGTVEKGPLLVAGGPSTGKANGYNADPTTGQYSNIPVGTGTPFGSVAVSIRSATADVNGDGVMDAVLVTGPGTPIRFAVLDGTNGMALIPSTAPFAGSENFTGGGFVAAADLDGDGRAEIIVTPDQGGGPRVTIFSLINGTPVVRGNFFGIDDANFRGGCRAATGDVNGDGTADLAVAAGFLGGPRVALFNGNTLFGTPTRLVGDFFSFPGTDATTLRNGVFLASGDVNGDGNADLIFGGGPGGAPRVFILSGKTVASGDVAGAQAHPVANFFVAGNTMDRGGVRLVAKDADGDHRAEVIAGSGEGSSANIRIYLGKNFTSSSEPSLFQDLTVFGGAAMAGGVYVG